MRRRWGPRGRWWRRSLAAATTAVVVVPVAAVALAASADPVLDVPLSGGAAWLPSPSQGLLTLVDGASERAVGTVAMAGARGGDDVAVHQRGMSALVVNDSRGTVSRVDAATWQQPPPVRLAEPGAGIVLRQPDVGQARATPAFVLDESAGAAVVVDPVSLAAERPLSLTARPTPEQSVVDDEGWLWVLDPRAGQVTWFDVSTDPATKRVADIDVGDAAQLTLVRDEVVVVDVDAGRLGPLTRDGRVSGWSCVDVPDDADVQVVGSQTAAEVHAVVPRHGTLLTAAVRGDDCSRLVEVADPGHDLGPVVQSDDYLFVPDRTTGRTVVVDLGSAEVTADIDVADPGAALELVVDGEIVFYNDRESDLAGVLRLDGAGRWVAGEPMRKFGSGVDELAEVPGRVDAALTGGGPGSDGGDGPADGSDDSAGLDPSVADAASAGEVREQQPAEPEPGLVVGEQPPALPGSGSPAGGSRVGSGDGGGPGGSSPGGGGTVPIAPPTGPTPTDDATGPDDDATTPPGTTTPLPTPPPAVTGLSAVPVTAVPGGSVTVTAQSRDAEEATWAWQATSGSGVLASGSQPGSFTFSVPPTQVSPVTVSVTVATGGGSDSATLTVEVQATLGTVSVSCSPAQPNLGDAVSCSGSVSGGTIQADTWTWRATVGATTVTESVPPGTPFGLGSLSPLQVAGRYSVQLDISGSGLAAQGSAEFQVRVNCRFTTAPESLDFPSWAEGTEARGRVHFTGCYPADSVTAGASPSQTWLSPLDSTPPVTITSAAEGAGYVDYGARLVSGPVTNTWTFPALTVTVNGQQASTQVPGSLPDPL